jgi:hypothetical protein
MLASTNPYITQHNITHAKRWAAFHGTRKLPLRERCHDVLLLLDDKSCPDMSQCSSLEENSICSWLHTVNMTGLREVGHEPISCRPT